MAIPEESRIKESKPTHRLPLQALPHTLDRGRYPRPEGGYPGRAVSGRGNPRASSFFRLFPIHWTVGGISTGEGQTRRAVSGRGNPHTGSLFRLFPIHWTVGGIASGGGADGEGAKAPSPVSGFSMRVPPPLPGPGIPGEGRIRGVSPYAGPWEASPQGRGRRGGGKGPLLCLWFQYAGTSAPVRSR